MQNADVAENFDNEYSFMKMTVDKTGAMGENNKVIYTFSELCVEYMRSGINDISVYVDLKLNVSSYIAAPEAGVHLWVCVCLQIVY